MGIFDKGFREILLSQFVSLIGGLIVGVVLAIYTDKLLLVPGMLIILPGFLEMRGNISGTFASRIASGLFLGVIKARNNSTKLIRGNKRASLILSMIVALFLGLMAFLFNYIALGVITPAIIALPFIAGVLSEMVEIPLTLFATIYFYRKGHDPNNIMGPFITSTGDISSVMALLIAMVIVL